MSLATRSITIVISVLCIGVGVTSLDSWYRSGVAFASASTSCREPSAEQPSSAYDFVNSIGVNTHLNYFDWQYGNFQFVKKELQAIGIRHLRDGIHFQNSDYNNLLYGRWGELGTVGIRFDAVVDPRSNLGPMKPELLEEANTSSHHSIEAFEGPNELDISRMSNWIATDRDYAKALFNSVSALADRTRFQVIAPSLAFAQRGSELGSLTDYIDAGNLHPYPAGKMPSQIFPAQTELEKKVSGTKNIVITESGYHNALNDHTDQPAVSELASSRYIPRLFLENFSRGIERTYLYELLDGPPDTGLTNNQFHWGLIRSNGSEKPAFAAMKRLIEELNDGTEPAHLDSLTWSIDSKNAQIHHLLLEKSSGEFDLVLWQETTSYDVTRQADIPVSPVQTTLALANPARKIIVYEPSVQSEPLKTATNTTTLPLAIPDHPLVVSISVR
jgi:hypothetical protein